VRRAAVAGWCPTCAVLLEHAGGLLAGQILLAAASPEELDTPPRGV